MHAYTPFMKVIIEEKQKEHILRFLTLIRRKRDNPIVARFLPSKYVFSELRLIDCYYITLLQKVKCVVSEKIISDWIYSDAWDCSKASGKEEQEQKDRLTCLAKCQTSSPAVAPHQKAKRESLLLIPIYLQCCLKCCESQTLAKGNCNATVYNY
ncbi:hypothetical protein MTR67_000380 [Solanum verrucosum]|uniref:Uncharacterized protein n=1 Tax=Solanum verrucosum TaxID=315347 RepID=A0AAF0PNK9_SOLVR|nr:hypothetical protein MTR67_000380 [Solanum verrucosum]